MSEGWRIPQNWRLQPARYGTGSGGLKGSICPECAAIGYHGLRQLDEKPGTVEIKQFEAIVLSAETTVAIENL